MRWKKYCSTDCTIELAECPLTGNLSLLLSTRTERPNTTEHNVPIFLDVKGPFSLHFQNRTSQYLSHSEWNRTSQCYWTQCPNTSWCQGSYFSPFSELYVPIFRSFWVEHNVPILRLVMGLIYLSDLWTHINLKSVWSSLNLVWHMSCRKLIVPVKFRVWTFINLNLVVIYVHTYLMCTIWVVIEHIQYLDGILTTYIDYIVCAFELCMTCIQVESDCSSCRRSGSAN